MDNDGKLIRKKKQQINIENSVQKPLEQDTQISTVNLKKKLDNNQISETVPQKNTPKGGTVVGTILMIIIIAVLRVGLKAWQQSERHSNYYRNYSSSYTTPSTSSYDNTNSETKEKTAAKKPKLDPNIKYIETVLDKQVLYQLGYNPADKKNFTSVKIPYTYEFKGKHYKITKVGEKAFFNYGALQNVTIEEGVQILGVSAFESCTALTTVKLPSSINKINNNVFANCKALKNVNLPDGLTELRDSLFYNCISLSNIEIPSSVTSIGDMVFYKCKALKKISLPKNLISIGQSAFAGCRGLEDLEIPNNVRRIGQWAFSNCVSINYLTVPDDVNSIGEEAFANVGYVYYDGYVTGQPWGALDSNKIPEISYSLEDILQLNKSYIIYEVFGQPTKQEFLGRFKTSYRPYPIYASWHGDSVMLLYDNFGEDTVYYSILSCSRNWVKTNAGIQVGDSEGKLLGAYSGLQKVKNGYYINPSEDGNYIYFNVKDGKVRKIYISKSFEQNSKSFIEPQLYEVIAKSEGF